eukprot:403351803
MGQETSQPASSSSSKQRNSERYSREEYLPYLSLIKIVRPTFLNYLIDVEGGMFQYAYDSPEGGNKTIGVGHKLRDYEANKTHATIQECLQYLADDLAEAESIVIQKLKANNQVYYSLNQDQKEMLIDFAFNLGPSFYQKFPKFIGALLSNDKEIMRQEYKRGFTNEQKQFKYLDDRNRKFAALFGLE